MMGLFASLLVNAVIAAAPATPLPWYNFDDYPQKAFDNEWKGAAVFEVTVAPDGRPVDCKITHSTGYEVLDRQTCWVAMKRAKFSPARGPEGTPAYGTYRSLVNWHRPDRSRLQADPAPDLEISVAALPDGTKNPAAVKVAYYMDAAGNPSSCNVMPDSLPQPKPLIDAACAQLLEKIQRVPVSVGASSVPAVKTAAVLFTVGNK